MEISVRVLEWKQGAFLYPTFKTFTNFMANSYSVPIEQALCEISKADTSSIFCSRKVSSELVIGGIFSPISVWVHALLWVAEHVRVHTWRTCMAVEATGCPLFLGHHKIPLGQDLFLNLWLVFLNLWLGWKPTSPNHPPVSAHLGAGSQACLGHLACYTGAGNNCKPHNYTFSDLHQGIPPVHILNIFSYS